VTLRARLTAGFLAVVLGPVLLGALFVGVTAAQVNRARAGERLELAVTAVKSSLGSVCQRLRAAGETAVLLGADPTAAREVIDRHLATGLRVVGDDGTVRYVSAGLPPAPWADCAGGAGRRATYTAIFARVQLPSGGWADAVEPVNEALLRRLATAGQANVTVLPPAGTGLSTERREDLAEVTAAARGVPPGTMVDTDGGRRLCWLAPGAGQPLPLVLSVGQDDQHGLYVVLVSVVVVAGLLAVAAAWWLARRTTRSLTELAQAVDRMASGDLTARVPVRNQNEIGRLGQTFNRMAQETQGYVRALTASRDQLRGNLALLGDTLSSTHDLDRILQVILQTALAATGAQAGIVVLLDPAADMLVGQCGEGLNERLAGGKPLGGALDGPLDGALDVTEVRVPLGEGLLGWVAATGEALRGRVDRNGGRLARAEPRCRTYVAVPFAAGVDPLRGLGDGDETRPSAARGVLALYDRHGFDEFDDADLVTLRTFAGQAAVALDNVRVHEEAQRLSLTDPLTGLSNYRYLKESMRREAERASRFGRTLAVLALDLDRFKEVNDRYGHPAGDAVLAEFARRLRTEIREVDFAFRHGGEEFVVLLPETDSAGATVLAERLGAAVRRTPVLVAGVDSAEPARISTTVSIGIAVYPDHGPTGEAVLQAADDALYAAKAAGRDTYRMAAPPGPGLAEPDGSAGYQAVPGEPQPPAFLGSQPRSSGGSELPGSGSQPRSSGGPRPPRQSSGG
jgi:two-component system, cell cycle response regulator